MNRLLLSKDIYSMHLIEKTAVAFSKLAKITLHNEANYTVCIFEDCIYPQEQTISEFENYLIDLHNKVKH